MTRDRELELMAKGLAAEQREEGGVNALAALARVGESAGITAEQLTRNIDRARENLSIKTEQSAYARVRIIEKNPPTENEMLDWSDLDPSDPRVTTITWWP